MFTKLDTYNKKVNVWENIHTVKLLYLIVNHGSGYKTNTSKKYLFFDDSVNENKWLLKKNVDIWGETKNEIKAINGGKENDYGKDYMKIKFTSVAIIIRSVFEGGKLYPQVFFR